MVLFATNMVGRICNNVDRKEIAFLTSIGVSTDYLYSGYRIASVINRKPSKHWDFRYIESKLLVKIPTYVNTFSTSEI